jgi:hypothetical protein
MRGWDFVNRRYKANFNPDQPRVPAGNPDGGQWTSDGGGNGGINDPRVVSDALPDRPAAHTWICRASCEDPLQIERSRCRNAHSAGAFTEDGKILIDVRPRFETWCGTR